MSMFFWKTRKFTRPQTSCQARLRLEQLEDRAVPALTAGALTPMVATEGSAFTNVVLFHFSDDDGAAASQFTAAVNWGDGQSDTVTSTASGAGQIVANAGGGFDVQGSHSYKEEFSSATFSVQVKDSDTVDTLPLQSVQVKVADAPLNATGQALRGLEGMSIATVTVASFTNLGRRTKSQR